MSSFNGHAFIAGLTETGDTVTVSGYGTVFADSIPIQHISRLTEHVGVSGQMGALQWDDTHYEIGMTFRPAKKTAGIDVANYPVFVPKGSKVILSGFHAIKETDGKTTGATLTAVLNAEWIVVGDTSVTLNASGVADVQLALRRYPGNPDLHVQVPPAPTPPAR